MATLVIDILPDCLYLNLTATSPHPPPTAISRPRAGRAHLRPDRPLYRSTPTSPTPFISPTASRPPSFNPAVGRHFLLTQRYFSISPIFYERQAKALPLPIPPSPSPFSPFLSLPANSPSIHSASYIFLQLQIFSTVCAAIDSLSAQNAA